MRNIWPPIQRRPSACAVAFAFLFLIPDTRAQDVQVSQFIGMTNTVADEYGMPLPGTEQEAGLYGHPVVEGDVVQVFQATDNLIHAPATNGTPHANNRLVLTTRIGRGITPTLAVPAKFSGAVTPRPGGNSRIFARVFNATTVEDASFYADSQLFLVKSFKQEIFQPNFKKTDQPLDPNDSDGDGLNNSWEKSLGSDPNSRDTDGDGMSDAEEALARTDLLDAQSQLMIVRVLPAGGLDAKLKWDSAVGVKYRVEYTASLTAPSPAYTVVTNVVATNTVTEVVVGNGLAGAGRCYRVTAY